MNGMEPVLGYFLAFALIAVFAVLIIGIISFAVHGRFNAKHSNNLMRARVIFQGIAIAVFALLVLYATD